MASALSVFYTPQRSDRSMQHQAGDEEWMATYRRMAQYIILAVVYVLLFTLGDTCFGEYWISLPTMIIQVVAVASLCHATTALFSTNIANTERCRQVRFSIIWLMIGIILAVITSIVSMAADGSMMGWLFLTSGSSTTAKVANVISSHTD